MIPAPESSNSSDKTQNAPGQPPSAVPGKPISWWWLLTAAIVLLIAWRIFAGRGPKTVDEQGAMAQVTLSLQHAQSKRYQECIDAATQALKLKPETPAAYLNIGWCYGGLGNWDEAIRNTREALRISPGWTAASANLAWMLRQKAAAAAHSEPPGPAELYLQSSLEHAMAQRYQACIDSAKQALNVKPDMAAAYSNIGWCYAKMGRWDDGIQNTLTALRFDPENTYARNNLKWMMEQKGGGNTKR